MHCFYPWRTFQRAIFSCSSSISVLPQPFLCVKMPRAACYTSVSSFTAQNASDLGVQGNNECVFVPHSECGSLPGKSSFIFSCLHLSGALLEEEERKVWTWLWYKSESTKEYELYFCKLVLNTKNTACSWGVNVRLPAEQPQKLLEISLWNINLMFFWF